MAVPELVRFLERYASHVDAPVRTRTDGDVARGGAAVGTWCRPPTPRPGEAPVVVLATGAFNLAPRPGPRGRRCPPRSSRSRCSTTSDRTSCGRAGCWSSAPPRRASRSPTSCCARAARSRSPSASTSACPAPTGRGTSCGGSTASAASTSASIRSTTSCAPARPLAAARRHAGPQRPRPQRAGARGAELVGRLARCATARPTSPARCATSARSPTSSSTACSTPSTRGRQRPGSATRTARLRSRPGCPRTPRLPIDLVADGYETVVWATGFRADYSWLELPVLDRKGEIRHDGGVVRDAPGLYRIGLNFLRRRKSSFIHGAERRRDGYRRPPGRLPERSVKPTAALERVLARARPAVAAASSPAIGSRPIRACGGRRRTAARRHRAAATDVRVLARQAAADG